MRSPYLIPHAGRRRARQWAAWLVLILHQATAHTDEAAGWRLRHTDETTGTRVYLRDRGDAAPEFRAVTRMAVRLSTLVAVLLDTDRMPEWVYRTRQVTRLGRLEPTKGVSQVITAMPWPLRDREAVVAWHMAQEPRSGTVTIEGRSAKTGLPQKEDWVRMPSFESRWRFEPLADGQVEVRFEGFGDPGGSLALPLLREFVNAAVWEAPLLTVNALRQMVVRDEYRRAVFPFIREPAP
jgi:hypothetical protein